MKLTIKNIYNHFKISTISTNIDKNSSETPLYEAKLITKTQNKFNKTVIYVATTKFLLDNNIILDNANIVLINDSEVVLESKYIENSNYIRLNNTCDIFEIFNEINEIFTKNASVHLLENAKDLSSLIEISSQILNNPVVIFDNSYRILASSEISELTDKIWIDNIKRGYCSYEFISYIRKTDSLIISLNNSTPFCVECFLSTIEKYVSKIFLHGRCIGYFLVLIDNSSMSENDLELLPLIAGVTSKVIDKTFNYRNLNYMNYETLFMDLLDNKIKDTKSLNEKLISYNEKFRDNFIIVAIDITNFETKGKTPNYLSNNLENLLNGRRHIYYENYIVTIYDFNKFSYISEEMQGQLESFAQKNNILIGISSTFSDLLNCRRYFEEAISAISINQKRHQENVINYYNPIRFHDFILQSSENLNIENFRHPALETLKIYDLNNNTDYYNTLYIYLNKNQNVVNVGKEIFIHRNTVKYRINKIVELTNLDLNNDDEVFHVLFSYKSIF